MKILISITGCIILSLCIYSYSLYTNLNSRNAALISALEQLETRTERLGLYEKQYLNSVRMNNTVLNLDSVSVLDVNDTVPLASIINGPTLVYKFSFSDCNECVNGHLNLLKQFAQKTPGVRLIVIDQFDHPRNYRFRLANISDLKVFGAFKNFPVSDQSFFIIDRSGIASSFYFPQTNGERFTSEYMAVVSKRVKP